MTSPQGSAHPFAGIDLAGLDAAFPTLLAQAAADALPPDGSPVGEGLSARERRLFRFGILVGLGEWGLAQESMVSLLDTHLLPGPALEHALAEAAVVKGWPVCVHLGPTLSSRGLYGPASVAEALARVSAAGPAPSPPGATPAGELTDREVFALGLGITWGARCWDT
jgi:hypothetical protein